MVSLRTVSMFASLILLSSAVAAIAAPDVSPSPAAIPSIKSPVESPLLQVQPSRSVPRLLVTRKVQRDLAQRLNVKPEAITVIAATRETWPDQCLGLARPFERCKGGEVSGWRIQVSSAQQQWMYRTNRTGSQMGIEPLTGTPDFGHGEFSVETSRLLLSAVAKQVNQPLAKLRVVEVQPEVWDGCLGIFAPGRACTQQAISGFRTSVTDGQTVWIYHLSEDGSQIAQNATASGATKPLQVVFVPIESEPFSEVELDPQIVFQSQLSGNLSGSVQTTVLLADGTVYREESQGASKPTRTVIKTLSANKVKAFQASLQQHRFPNFNNIRYLTEAALADYPLTQLQAPGLSAAYIDLEMASLPADLRSIIAEWDAIVQ